MGMKPVGSSNNTNSKKKRILIVDDETDINYTFEAVLEENGFVVDSLDDPVLALNSLSLICMILYFLT
jgi:DNA-binding response OmpR family regulator